MFTVIIPLYNKESHIEKTLLSALKQNQQDFEIIIVDDGSTDNSVLQIKEYLMKESSKIKLVQQHNQGVSAARNTGIKYAKGEYIAFLDADDIWKPDYLENISKLVDKFPESDIFTTSYRVILGENNIKYSMEEKCHSKEFNVDYWTMINNKYEFVWTSATTVRKRALEGMTHFRVEETIGEDLDFFSRIALKNPNIAHSSSYSVDYNRYAENNARTSGKIAYPKAYLKILQEQLSNPSLSNLQKRNIKLKYDKKIIAYIYTLILARRKKEAKIVIKKWETEKKIIKFLLKLALISPFILINLVYKVRLKVF